MSTKGLAVGSDYHPREEFLNALLHGLGVVFGIVALVAMMPLITVQAMGVVYVIKSRRQAKTVAQSVYAENDVIELWEV